MTDFAALDALYPLPPEELPRQFVLTASADLLPAAWEADMLGGWHFAAHPDARVLALRAADGSRLGWAVNVLAQLGPEGDRIPQDALILPVGPDPTPADLERALYGRNDEGVNDEGHGLEGGWIAFVIAPSVRRVYVNPTGTVVYSPEHRAVAASHNLIPGLKRDLDLSQAFDPLATTYRYAFGLTAHHSLHRLVPNHVLDLDTFEPHRHWPVGETPSYANGHEGVERVVAHTRRVLRVVFEAVPRRARIGLTAGRDSRAVLAMLQPFVEATPGPADAPLDVLLMTRLASSKGHRLDVEAAKRVARIAGLPHRIVALQERAEEEVLKRFVRIGEARGGRILRASPVEPEVLEDRFGLNGMNGGVGRGVYWPRLHFEPSDLRPALFTRYAKAPPIPAVLAAAQAWWEGVPADLREHVPTMMELLYVEQREGCWAGPAAYLNETCTWGYGPFRGAHNIGAMFRLPVAYRAVREFQHDIVAYAWPELMAVPFNEPVGRLATQRRIEEVANVLSMRYVSGFLRRTARLVGPEKL